MIISRRWMRITSWSENRSIRIQEDEIMPKDRINTSMRPTSLPRCPIKGQNLEGSTMSQAIPKRTLWICNKNQWMTYTDSWWNSRISKKSMKNPSSLDMIGSMVVSKTLKYCNNRESIIRWEQIKPKKILLDITSKETWWTKIKITGMENVVQKAAIYMLAKQNGSITANFKIIKLSIHTPIPLATNSTRLPIRSKPRIKHWTSTINKTTWIIHRATTIENPYSHKIPENLFWRISKAWFKIQETQIQINIKKMWMKQHLHRWRFISILIMEVLISIFRPTTSIR